MAPDSNKQQQRDTKIDFSVLAEQLQPLVAAYACMTDAEVARAVWRKQMIAAGVCADCAASGHGPIVGVLDKVGAFLDKAASGFVQLHGALQGAAAQESAAADADGLRPCENDPLAHAIETWARRAD
jgi:hypothetical protein